METQNSNGHRPRRLELRSNTHEAILVDTQ